jgi:transcriptional repressor NrdR
MKCPFCGNQDTKVLESRETEEFSVTRRRRECTKCESRFTTYERVEISIRVVKKDGTSQQFNREKIISGLEKSCEKRQITQEQIENIASKIESHIMKKGLKEIKTSKIGEIIMRELKKLDKVAYIRFASVYKDFADIESFTEELKRLTK